MIITIKETLYINGKEEVPRVIKSGTRGVEKSGMVMFYDVTKTFAVSVPRETCINDPQMFSVKRVVDDREIPISDIIRAVAEMDFLDTATTNKIIEELKTTF